MKKPVSGPLLPIITLFCWSLTVSSSHAQSHFPQPPNGRSALDFEFKFSDDPAPPAPLEINLTDLNSFSSLPAFESAAIRYDSHQAMKSDSAPKSDPTQYSSPAILEASHARAGFPLSLSKRAALTYDEKYTGYYVGGGVPPGRWWNRSFGQPRFRHEGTWGMDYAPSYSRVVSNWSHGRLYQGGTGLYEPDRKNRPFDLTFGRFRSTENHSAESAHDSENPH